MIVSNLYRDLRLSPGDTLTVVWPPGDLGPIIPPLVFTADQPVTLAVKDINMMAEIHLGYHKSRIMALIEANQPLSGLSK